MVKRERLKVDEVVQYHMSNQITIRDNRITVKTTIKPKMNWEREMKRVLQDKQYKLFV